MEQQIHIVHRGIINQPITFAGFVHIPGNFIFDLRAVDEKHVPSAYLTSTQVASKLNSQKIIFTMLSPKNSHKAGGMLCPYKRHLLAEPSGSRIIFLLHPCPIANFIGGGVQSFSAQ